ncbi:hypothetical protein NL676_030465 [Syzygium grande]|nr:hypothetical protein NL676_030465 [Syzygium grande]
MHVPFLAGQNGTTSLHWCCRASSQPRSPDQAKACHRAAAGAGRPLPRVAEPTNPLAGTRGGACLGVLNSSEAGDWLPTGITRRAGRPTPPRVGRPLATAAWSPDPADLGGASSPRPGSIHAT